MVSVGIIGEFPLRSIFMSSSIIRLVVGGSRVFVSWAYLSFKLDSIMRAFTYVCLQLIFSRSKAILINNWTFMISFRVIGEFPLRISFMSHGVLWSVICRARISICRTRCL
jgi:hypothetical protein